MPSAYAGASPAHTDRGKHETRSTEELVRAVHALPDLAHLSPAKVSKLVRRFQRDAELHCTPFEVWAANVATCPPQAARPHRNWWGVVDPTGETAARRVDAERLGVAG